jgi:hypothetical protein
MWLLIALAIGLGVQTSLTAGIAQRAALWLLAGAP